MGGRKRRGGNAFLKFFSAPVVYPCYGNSFHGALMKIDSSTNVYNLAPRAKSEAPVANTKAAPAKSQAPEINNQDLAAVMQGSSDVDVNKVNAVRQALEAGQIRFDADGLAESILATHQP